jgi:hypothetical protein
MVDKTVGGYRWLFEDVGGYRRLFGTRGFGGTR